MILSKKQITNALISLHGWTGWYSPLFSHPKDRFSPVNAFFMKGFWNTQTDMENTLHTSAISYQTHIKTTKTFFKFLFSSTSNIQRNREYPAENKLNVLYSDYI